MAAGRFSSCSHEVMDPGKVILGGTGMRGQRGAAERREGEICSRARLSIGSGTRAWVITDTAAYALAS